jgi:poly(hydroxyalkanoate) granule-associated protein
MFEAFDRMMFAGLGALSMTRQRAEEIFEECVKRGQTVQENKSRFVKDLMDSAERTRQDFEKMVTEQVQKGVTKMQVATQQDIQRLEQKLDAILQKLG